MAKYKKQKKQGGVRAPILANIKVVGIGGGGGNMVERISRNFARGVDFIAVNTDQQDLDHCHVRQKIYIGRNLTKGLGTGMNPDLGRQAAEENRSELAEAVKDADMVFLAAGFGGGTGGGATPVIAEAARQQGALTVAVVTKPFAFEGSQRERNAQEAVAKIKDKVDALIIVPNDRIFNVISKDTPVLKAFEAIDDVLGNALRGIVEIIALPGLINVDFADVRTIVQDAGAAIVGVGLGSGPERAVHAVNAAMNSPLLEASAEGAKAVLLGIFGGRDLKMAEVNEAAKLVSQMADPGARIIFGAYHDRSMRPNQVKVTLIATGFNGAAGRGSLFASNNGHGDRLGVLGGARAADGGFDARKAERPATVSEEKKPVMKEEMTVVKKPPLKKAQEKEDDNTWDVPAFWRRKKR